MVDFASDVNEVLDIGKRTDVSDKGLTTRQRLIRIDWRIAIESDDATTFGDKSIGDRATDALACAEYGYALVLEIHLHGRGSRIGVSWLRNVFDAVYFGLQMGAYGLEHWSLQKDDSPPISLGSPQ